METVKKEIKAYMIDTIISIMFFISLVLLKLTHKIEEKTFILGLILWAIITPSPHRWAITLGNWLKAAKNGKIEVSAGGGESVDGGESEPSEEE